MIYYSRFIKNSNTKYSAGTINFVSPLGLYCPIATSKSTMSIYNSDHVRIVNTIYISLRYFADDFASFARN